MGGISFFKKGELAFQNTHQPSNHLQRRSLSQASQAPDVQVTGHRVLNTRTRSLRAVFFAFSILCSLRGKPCGATPYACACVRADVSRRGCHRRGATFLQKWFLFCLSERRNRAAQSAAIPRMCVRACSPARQHPRDDGAHTAHSRRRAVWPTPRPARCWQGDPPACTFVFILRCTCRVQPAPTAPARSRSKQRARAATAA
jgi:hypothetical protein